MVESTCHALLVQPVAARNIRASGRSIILGMGFFLPEIMWTRGFTFGDTYTTSLFGDTQSDIHARKKRGHSNMGVLWKESFGVLF